MNFIPSSVAALSSSRLAAAPSVAALSFAGGGAVARLAAALGWVRSSRGLSAAVGFAGGAWWLVVAPAALLSALSLPPSACGLSPGGAPAALGCCRWGVRCES
jgi:hypothetical protein